MNKLKGPTQLVLDITNRCNLRCLHCFNSSGDGNNELSDKEIIRLIFEIVRIRPFNVCFSGGEPLLRRNLLFDCLEILASNSIRTVVLTNGTLLNKKTIKTFLKLKVQEIEVSLDGPTEEIHNRLRGNSFFIKIIETLKTLKEMQFPQYEVSLVITPFNWRELSSMIIFLSELETPLLILRPMLICGRALKYKDSLLPTPLQYRKVWYMINNLANRKETKIKIMYVDPLSHIYSFSSGKDFFGMEIKANGDLIISPYIQLPIGNIRRHSLEDYWNKGWPLVWQLQIIKNLISKIKGSSFEEVESAIKQIRRIDLIDNV